MIATAILALMAATVSVSAVADDGREEVVAVGQEFIFEYGMVVLSEDSITIMAFNWSDADIQSDSDSGDWARMQIWSNWFTLPFDPPPAWPPRITEPKENPFNRRSGLYEKTKRERLRVRFP